MVGVEAVDDFSCRAFVEQGGAVAYEDFFADPESAALARDLAIVTLQLRAEKNFPELDQGELCRRLLSLMHQHEQIGLPNAFAWLQPIGLDVDAFMKLAED